MAIELWIRNPGLCIRECLEENVKNIVWDIGYLRKRNIDPEKFLQVYYPASMQWRMLIVGRSDQGASEVRPGYTFRKPYAEHPVWEYGQSGTLLEEMMATLPDDKMLVLSGITNENGQANRLFRLIEDLREEYPWKKLHYHGSYSYRQMFGLCFNSVDWDPRFDAHKGKVVLPVGKVLTYEKAAEAYQWVHLLNMVPKDLAVPRNRCIYNIRSAEWAAKFYRREVKWHTSRHVEIDPESYTILESYKTAPRRIFLKNDLDKKAGDLFLCDLCSVQLDCRYFRTGCVCAVPNSEPADLARYFKSRDSDVIIEGLGTLLATQTRRLERAIVEEENAEKVSPDVTKLINELFDRGVKLAKLVDPALAAAGSAKVNLRFTQNNAAITTATPQSLMAGVVAELEARGIPRSKITPDMIEMLLGEKRELLAENVIDAAVVESNSGD